MGDLASQPAQWDEDGGQHHTMQHAAAAVVACVAWLARVERARLVRCFHAWRCQPGSSVGECSAGDACMHERAAQRVPHQAGRVNEWLCSV